MLRATLFFAVISFAAVPFAASAQAVAPPAVPAPVTVAQDDARPTPAPPEKFVMVDGAITGKTYDEFAPGATTSGFGVRAAAEVPVIGHNWMAQIDYRQYNYPHASTGAFANGITQACPAGNPGCVTPIGYQTYDAAISPAPVKFVNAFGVNDSTTQFGIGTKIAPVERYYLSVGGVIRGTNASGYPTESGMGFGIDKLPDTDRLWSFYGNFWLYFNVNGNATGPTSAALGSLSGYPFTVAYRLYAYRFGVTVSLPRTPIFLDISDVGDRADGSANAPSAAAHNALFMGAGAHF